MDHSIYLYGIRYPNRVFVGGLPKEATANEVAEFFGAFGKVIESKVILNEEGVSKGYGFVTFETKRDVSTVFHQGVIFFKNKKLNLGPAVRKQVTEAPGEPVLLPQGHQGTYPIPETMGGAYYLPQPQQGTYSVPLPVYQVMNS